MAASNEKLDIRITIESEPVDIEKGTTPPRIFFDVIYQRVVKILPETSTPPPSPPSGDTTGTPSTPGSTAPLQTVKIGETVRAQLDIDFKGSVVLQDVANPSRIGVNFLGFDGTALITKVLETAKAADGALNITLDHVETEKLIEPVTLPEKVPPPILRDGILVPIGFAPGVFNFPSMLFQIAPVDDTIKASWTKDEIMALFGAEFESASTTVKDRLPSIVKNWPWRPIRVAVDGTLIAKFSKDEADKVKGWAWMLAGPGKPTFLGVVVEIISAGLLPRSIILQLPDDGEDRPGKPTDSVTHSEKDCHCNDTARKPVAVSEAELANNPGVYTEDPGAFCKPFSNPERVLSEHSFFTVLRVEAPVISAEASEKLEEPAAIDFDPPKEMLENINADPVDANIGMQLRSLTLSSGGRFDTSMTGVGSKLSSAGMFNKINSNIAVLKPKFPVEMIDIFKQMNRGRSEMNARNPAQWDSHSLRYQATTVAVGHILEFRVRTRSNGYSLGGVAKTLTLAPRQTTRIQKVQWSRSERAQRIESTQSGDQSNDSMTHDTTYQDAVSATLREWAQGSSSSSVTAAAAGVGAVLGPVAIGGGVAHSSSISRSQQSGGRDSTAHEESQWRDAIRRHGDSLRKFESMVVQEVNQQEQVTGTVEVVRNINYAHSLTVIYHNILRHLKVSTEFAGVRECLFVPFAMKPFTMERAYRWRDTLKSSLRDRKFRHALTYLKDVLTGFKYSKIPPGRRADQPIRALYGSLYIDLGIARPLDADDGKLRQDLWTVLSPYLPLPIIGVWQTVAQQIEANRDALFQRNFGPSIATKWANVIELKTSSGTPIKADFTLASKYSYNRTVRIDFQVNTTTNLTRSMLMEIKINASAGLSVGSVANVRSMQYRYQTDYESRDVFLSQGSQDLIDYSTGQPDNNGATIAFPLTQYEMQNPRADLVYETMEFLEHLNEHVEYYHKMIWWMMDRDRLFMLIDGFMVPRSDPATSIASVVERNPIAIAGNSLVFRVAAGAFIGSTLAKTPEDLYNWYDNHGTVSDPMLVSLPTDGLYAQTIKDECTALEEHYGNLDWALNDPDPELGTLDPSLLASRRSDPGSLEPSKLPDTLINLSNGGQAPAPQGFAGVLGAVQNGEAFRDMAGLAGTQSLAQAGLQTAASLATSFGGTAASLKLAEMAAQKQAVQDADKKLASIKNAKDKGLQSDEAAKSNADKVLKDMSGPATEAPPHQDRAVQDLIQAATTVPNSTVAAATKSGAVQVAFGITEPAARRAKADPWTNPKYFEAVEAAKKNPRPTWSQWDAAYPSYIKESDSDAWRTSIGGGVKAFPAETNSCAMRWSRGWNYAIGPLPNIPGDSNKYKDPFTPMFVVKGADKKNYAIRSKDVREWLRRVWGDADIDESAPTKPPRIGWFDKSKFGDMNGVLCFTIDFTDATGHVDILVKKEGKYLHSSEHEADPTEKRYWNMANRIEFWKLTDEVVVPAPAPAPGGASDGGEAVPIVDSDINDGGSPPGGILEV